MGVIIKVNGRVVFKMEKVFVDLFRIIVCSWVGYKKGEILE
jgi:hypothetical protein